jgi:hypothetical protein
MGILSKDGLNFGVAIINTTHTRPLRPGIVRSTFRWRLRQELKVGH